MHMNQLELVLELVLAVRVLSTTVPTLTLSVKPFPSLGHTFRVLGDHRQRHDETHERHQYNQGAQELGDRPFAADLEPAGGL